MSARRTVGPLALLCLATTALAVDVPLPSYRDEIVVAEWLAIDAAITRACVWPRGGPKGVGAPLQCKADDLDVLIARARAFQDTVTPDGRLQYLIGLAQRHKGDLAAAERSLREAVRLDPSRAEAWFDLGELLESRSDWRGADEAFERVVALVPDGTRAWPGWFKRAQVAAHLRPPDVEAFESSLKQALRYGFSFRMVEGEQVWREFYAHPDLHDALERLLLVYSDDEVRESLAPPP